ncbi:hypothetical protein [Nocardioides hungaricus]
MAYDEELAARIRDHVQGVDPPVSDLERWVDIGIGSRAHCRRRRTSTS